MKPPASVAAPSSAILTIPNAITFMRLAMIPVFLWFGLDEDRVLPAFIIGGIAGSTDFIDGIVARRLGQESKLGAAMDPLVDRLLVAAAATILIVRNYAPVWAVLLVVVRDALVLAAVPIVSARGAPRPAVSKTGKAATMGIMWGFGLMIGAHLTDPPSNWVRVIAWIFYVPGVGLSYAAAAGYAAAARRALHEAPR